MEEEHMNLEEVIPFLEDLSKASYLVCSDRVVLLETVLSLKRLEKAIKLCKKVKMPFMSQFDYEIKMAEYNLSKDILKILEKY